MPNLRERIEETLDYVYSCDVKSDKQDKNKIISQATDQILQALEIKLQGILSKFYTCDNLNCGKGAICNYCALRKDIETCLAQIRERIGEG